MDQRAARSLRRTAGWALVLTLAALAAALMTMPSQANGPFYFCNSGGTAAHLSPGEVCGSVNGRFSTIKAVNLSNNGKICVLARVAGTPRQDCNLSGGEAAIDTAAGNQCRDVDNGRIKNDGGSAIYGKGKYWNCN